MFKVYLNRLFLNFVKQKVNLKSLIHLFNANKNIFVQLLFIKNYKIL